MGSVFFSYRRGDSPDAVKLIHERLKQRLPRWEIFYDHQSIPLGEKFPDLLRAKVTSATAVLVIIGPKWLEILNGRKSAPIDHVREEVRLALECGTNVVPILVSKSVMPTDADLADFPDLKPLLLRNGRPVRPDPDFDSDLEPLIAHLKQLDSGETIGTILDDKYTLTAEIGHGGMGVVYAAEQKHPVKRSVAVKLIKPGMDSRDVLARFDAERQALAVMDHPNIAKVLDAGMAASGRPYFVMEQVKGVPITQYCDEKKLTPQERINLFIPVCNAVQHAHQKGIIHRDIKPTNVLVEVIDGKPVPKVIDFGLAKALGQKLTDKTLHTAMDTRVGTLEYSAPEQAAGRSFDVDTRSDIYSLGVLLYELLTGAPPFTHEELLKVGEEEMRRVIREVEPTKPSKKLSSSGELPAIAANRHLEPNKLTRMVQGDLDWIVMKCLEKENARRYETANQLGQELQRFLANEPVQAGPPSASYRMKKFLRRNRGPVIAATLVLLALVGSIISTSVGLAMAERARDKAQKAVAGEKAATKKALDAKLVAQKRLQQVHDIIDAIFLGEDWTLLVDGKDRDGKGQRDRMIKGLDRVAKKLITETTDDQVTVNKLRFLLARNYNLLGAYAKAIPLFEKALEKQRAGLNLDEPTTMEAVDSLFYTYTFANEVDKALSLVDLLLQNSKPAAGPKYVAWLAKRDSLAFLYRDVGKVEKGLELLEQALKRQDSSLDPNDPAAWRTIEELATMYSYNRIKPERAVRLYEILLERKKAKFGADHYRETWRISRDLAFAHLQTKTPSNAIPHFNDFFAATRKQYDSLFAADMMDRIGEELLQTKFFPEMEQIVRECLEIRVKSWPEAWSTFNTKSLLGASLVGQKKYTDAEPLLKEGYEGIKQREKTMTPNTKVRLTKALERLVQLYDATGNAAEADRWRKELTARKAAEKEPKK